jgi:DNA end-binding protein Ku
MIKGYEYEKGKYVVVDPEDLENIKIETTKVIEVAQFVEPDELDPIFLNAPYYLSATARSTSPSSSSPSSSSR